MTPTCKWQALALNGSAEASSSMLPFGRERGLCNSAVERPDGVHCCLFLVVSARRPQFVKETYSSPYPRHFDVNFCRLKPTVSIGNVDKPNSLDRLGVTFLEGADLHQQVRLKFQNPTLQFHFTKK